MRPKIFAYSKKAIFKASYRTRQLYWGSRYNFDELLKPDVYEARLHAISDRNDPPSEKYFVIQRSYKGIGLCTYICVFVAFIAYALRQGRIPIIDMRSYPNIYMPDKEVGMTNAWELYFEQPFGIGLNDLSPTSQVQKSSSVFLPNRTPNLKSLLNNRDEWALYSKIYRDLIRTNRKTAGYIQREKQDILTKGRTLGILYRGTDYTKGRPSKHPIQPTIEQLIMKAKPMMDSHDYIYLATDEREAHLQFEEAFPGNYSTHGIGTASHNREDDEFLKGLEYLSSIAILSECDSFVGGACAGTYVAFIMNDFCYDDYCVWDLGYYK